MEKQTALLETIRKSFEGVPIIVVESKCDIMRTDHDAIRISAETGEGMEELKQMLVEQLHEILRNRPLEEEPEAQE
jgi:nucleolar GTP-binding protein